MTNLTIHWDYELKNRFGEKVYRLALNGGMTCPNRDGRVGYGGCIFCSGGGSGEFAADPALSVREQIEEGKKTAGEETACSDLYRLFSGLHQHIRPRSLFARFIYRSDLLPGNRRTVSGPPVRTVCPMM